MMRLLDGTILRSNNQRDAYSQAECYREGRLVTASERRALALYHRAAEEGDARAYFRLGQHEQTQARWSAAFELFLQAGLRNNNDVIAWLDTLVSQNNAEAALVLGKIAQYKKQFDKAIQSYTKAHELRHPDGMFYFGKMYSNLTNTQTRGIDITNRYRDSARLGSKHGLNELMTLSASNGKASQHLAQMYELGEGGLSQNTSKALELYEKASEQRCYEATYYLAELYAKGKSRITVDISTACRYYLLASQQGCTYAISSWQSLAQQGHAEAQYRLGYEYYRTLSLGGYRNYSTQYDIPNAVTWCVKAAIQGHTSAVAYLSGTFTAEIFWRISNEYASGTINVERCQQKAVEYGMKASDLGFKEASRYLAKLFYEGNAYIPMDSIKSFKYFVTATKQGDSSALNILESYATSGDQEALFALAEYYRELGQDEISLRWFVRAEIAGHPQAKQMLKKSYTADHQWMIANVYLEFGLTQEDSRWRHHCQKAADKGNAHAAFYLAQQSEGLDVSHHRSSILTRYNTAAQSGNGESEAATHRFASELIYSTRNSGTLFASSNDASAGSTTPSLHSIQQKMKRK